MQPQPDAGLDLVLETWIAVDCMDGQSRMQSAHRCLASEPLTSAAWVRPTAPDDLKSVPLPFNVGRFRFYRVLAVMVPMAGSTYRLQTVKAFGQTGHYFVEAEVLDAADMVWAARRAGYAFPEWFPQRMQEQEVALGAILRNGSQFFFLPGDRQLTTDELNLLDRDGAPWPAAESFQAHVMPEGESS